MSHDINVLEGKIEPTLVKLALPILWGMLFEVLYNVADAYFLARMDMHNPAILAGVGLAFPIFFLMASLSIGLSSGTSTKTAIAIGADEPLEARRTISSATVLAIFLGLVMAAAILLFMDPIIKAISGAKISAEAMGYCHEYLLWLLPGFCMFVMSAGLFGSFEGEGKTKYIGLAMASSTIINILLDPLFIFTFHLGVKGAAIATTLANLFNLMFGVVIVLRKKNSFPVTFSRKYVKLKTMREVTVLGLPLAVGFVVISASLFVFNKFVGNVSQNAMNAFSIAMRTDYAVIIPVLAFGTGMGIMIGQSYGNENYKRLAEIYRKGIRIILLITSGVALPYMVFAPQIFGLFTSVDNVIDIAVTQVRVLTVATAIGTVWGVASGTLFQSTADPLKSLISIILRNLMISVPLMYALTRIYGNSMTYIWIAAGTGCVVGGAICHIWALSRIRKLLSRKA